MFNVLVILKSKDSVMVQETYENAIVTYAHIDSVSGSSDHNLCIVEADFSDISYLDKIKKFITHHTYMEFWAGNKLCTKDDIVTAYSLGCKNFVKFPITEKVLKKYFSTKNNTAANESPKLDIKENFENMRVLVIDDNEVNIELLKEVLAIFKLETMCFNNSQRALEYASNERVDLILLDIMMPNINGFEFAEELKKYDKNKDTPIVFISALSGAENKLKGFSLGSYAYIEKPFEINTVRAQIFNILKIQKLQKQKESFIATLTHDLRTPIRAQMRALELLLENKFGELNADQTEIMLEILSSCKFLHHMTDDLLVKYKFDNGSIRIKKEAHSLRDVVEDIIHSLRHLIEQKKQTVKYNYNSDIDQIEFDAPEISRVMNNILINASEYSAEGGEIIVQVDNNSKKQCIEVSVKDNGCSLSKAHIDSIFEEYYSKAKNHQKVGTGLGLFISKKIVQLHGGNIWAEVSENGLGAKFVFTIPYSGVLV